MFPDRFHSVLSVSEDMPFHPADQYQTRTAAMVLRGAGLAILVFVAFAPLFRASPLWGDERVLDRNPEIRSLNRLTAAWRHPFSHAALSPPASTLFYVEHLLFGADVHGYRAVNLAIHCANALLLWLILRRFAVDGAWLGAALFALHPLAAQPVAWLNQSGTILCAFLVLGSLHCFLRISSVQPDRVPEDWEDPGDGKTEDLQLTPWSRILLTVLSLGLYALAIMARPSAIVLPLIFFLMLLARRHRVRRAEWLWLIPFCAVACAAGIELLRTSAHPQPADPAAAAWAADAVAFWHGACKILWPHPLQLIYPRHAIGEAKYIVPGAVILLGLATPRAWRSASLAALLCFAILLISDLVGASRSSLPVTPAGWLLDYDALEYLAIAPLAAWAATVLMRLIAATSRHLPAPAVRWLLGCAILGGLGTLAWRHSADYASSELLWKKALAADPGCVFARCRLANYYMEQGQIDLAAEQVSAFRSQAIADPADHLDALLTRGQILEAMGRTGEAADEYRAALAQMPGEKSPTLRLAEIYSRTGRADEALQLYESALRRSPRDGVLHNNLGMLLLGQGRFAEAAGHLRIALEVDPASGPARLNLANALFAQGQLSEAADQLQELVKRDPNSFEAFMNAGAMLGQLKEFAKSERMLRAAVQLKPDSAEARNNLGIALAAQGHLSEAVYSFARAVALKPDFQDAKRNLEAAKRELAAKAPKPPA